MSGRTILQQELYEQFLDQGVDEDTADIMCREYADDEED
ncbi:hypothetical protein J2X60_002990 [Curtobacterium sp. 320]|nr:hypothetical protein [Curtobacterium sp. 320]